MSIVKYFVPSEDILLHPLPREVTPVIRVLNHEDAETDALAAYRAGGSVFHTGTDAPYYIWGGEAELGE